MNETKYSVLSNTKFIFRESSKIEKKEHSSSDDSERRACNS